MMQKCQRTTALEYDVVNAKLQYTYTTAYQEPKHAWLVPAWIFTVRESIGGNSLQELSYVINAYDGSVIGEAYQGSATLEFLLTIELQGLS